MALITATDLSLGYDSQIIVKDLNFKVEQGDYLCPWNATSPVTAGMKRYGVLADNSPLT